MLNQPYGNPIESSYAGFKFRSRTEAKYAILFDLFKWDWSYEPPEYDGWIPDFAIGPEPTMVEVKGFWNPDEFQEQLVKIRKSGCTGDVLLLGADPAFIASRFSPKRWSHCVSGEREYTVIGWVSKYEMDIEELRVGQGEIYYEGFGGWRTYTCDPMRTSEDARFPQDCVAQLREMWGHCHTMTRWMAKGKGNGTR
jgi:hypothetical protein